MSLYNSIYMSDRVYTVYKGNSMYICIHIIIKYIYIKLHDAHIHILIRNVRCYLRVHIHCV